MNEDEERGDKSTITRGANDSLCAARQIVVRLPDEILAEVSKTRVLHETCDGVLQVSRELLKQVARRSSNQLCWLFGSSHGETMINRSIWPHCLSDLFRSLVGYVNFTFSAVGMTSSESARLRI